MYRWFANILCFGMLTLLVGPWGVMLGISVWEHPIFGWALFCIGFVIVGAFWSDGGGHRITIINGFIKRR